ncbi:LCP family protein [Marinisporobacter balticus]|uniref:LCP family protein n=1 Tax=Marinisporobacter balticus TaxID=2018667 RepID=UPI00140482A9|nr:LCP family protein [Marinisporobacter balticus]
MKYKKPKIWVIVISILIIVAGGILLLSNPIDDSESNHEIINVLFMGVLEANLGETTPVDAFVLMGYEPSTGNLNISTVSRDTMIKDENRDTKLGNYAALHSPEQVMKELNNILGVNISKYIMIDTAAFRHFVDAIGGINYDVPQDMYYEDPMQGLHIELKKGPQILDGKKAEMLVRFRKGYLKGDLTRIDVQKDVLVAILTQESVTDIFKNIGSLYELVSKNIETNIDKKEVKKYSAIVRNNSIEKEDIKEINLPISAIMQEGIFYVIIDEEKAQKLTQGKF